MKKFNIMYVLLHFEILIERFKRIGYSYFIGLAVLFKAYFL